MTPSSYDLIVIGSGTAANVTAFNCRKAGRSVAGIGPVRRHLRTARL